MITNIKTILKILYNRNYILKNDLSLPDIKYIDIRYDISNIQPWMILIKIPYKTYIFDITKSEDIIKLLKFLNIPNDEVIKNSIDIKVYPIKKSISLGDNEINFYKHIKDKQMYVSYTCKGGK